MDDDARGLPHGEAPCISDTTKERDVVLSDDNSDAKLKHE